MKDLILMLMFTLLVMCYNVPHPHRIDRMGEMYVECCVHFSSYFSNSVLNSNVTFLISSFAPSSSCLGEDSCVSQQKSAVNA